METRTRNQKCQNGTSLGQKLSSEFGLKIAAVPGLDDTAGVTLAGRRVGAATVHD